MTGRELIVLLKKMGRDKTIDLNEELCVCLDVGELAILAEIDFVDGKHSMLACSVWGTDETEFSLVEEMEE